MNPELQIKLTIMYSAPNRHYHNMNHINHCLGELEKYLKYKPSKMDQNIEYALWFHDVIYNPYSDKNELNSAIFFDRLCEDINIPSIDRSVVFCLINGTKSHEVSSPSLEEAHNIINDIDYSILGQSQKVYLNYVENIRKEYYFIEYNDFSNMRKQFLETLLKEKRIYKTDFFHKKYEKTARTNVEKEIHMLST